MSETTEQTETLLQSWFLITTGVTMSTEENYLESGFFDREDLSLLFGFIADRFGVDLQPCQPLQSSYCSIHGLAEEILLHRPQRHFSMMLSTSPRAQHA